MKLFFHGNQIPVTQPTSAPVKLNNISINKCSCQKHLGNVLDSKLNFNTRVAQNFNTRVTNISIINKSST